MFAKYAFQLLICLSGLGLYATEAPTAPAPENSPSTNEPQAPELTPLQFQLKIARLFGKKPLVAGKLPLQEEITGRIKKWLSKALADTKTADNVSKR